MSNCVEKIKEYDRLVIWHVIKMVPYEMSKQSIARHRRNIELGGGLSWWSREVLTNNERYHALKGELWPE